MLKKYLQMDIETLYKKIETEVISESKGHIVVFDKFGCTVYEEWNFKANGDVVFTGTLNNGLYLANLDTREQVRALSVSSTESNDMLWHKRKDHFYRKATSTLKILVTGVNFSNDNKKLCLRCIEETIQKFSARKNKRSNEL